MFKTNSNLDICFQNFLSSHPFLFYLSTQHFQFEEDGVLKQVYKCLSENNSAIVLPYFSLMLECFIQLNFLLAQFNTFYFCQKEEKKLFFSTPSIIPILQPNSQQFHVGIQVYDSLAAPHSSASPRRKLLCSTSC